MALATPAFMGPQNMFIPAFTGRIVGYIRKKDQFALTKYAQFVKSTDTDKEGKPICTYFVLDPDEPVRTPQNADWSWAQGTRSPEAKIFVNGQFVTVIMDRKAFPYEYSGQAAQSADVPIGEIPRQIAVSIAMTNKTQRVVTLLETVSNWGSQTSDANSLNGGAGKWSTASADELSPQFAAIAKSITAAMQAINLKTNSVVRPSDLNLVLSPGLASAMANSGEIRAYLKSSPFAKEVEEGLANYDYTWNLPTKYNGVNVIVEDASVVTDRRNSSQTAATTGRTYIKKDTSAVLVSRQGGIDGVAGSPTMSTLQIYYYRFEMSVFERFEQWHDIHEGKVVDQYKEVLAAPSAGYLITNTL